MARAYSDDLRRKLLEAHAAGKGTLGELAERFGVSLPWAGGVGCAQRSGAVERAPQSRHGRASRVDRGLVRALLKVKPDMVLRELCEDLNPIEKAAKLKQLLRTTKARTAEALETGHRRPSSRCQAARRSTWFRTPFHTL
jgi:hypothetical protein